MERSFNFTDAELRKLPFSAERTTYLDQGGAHSVAGLQLRVGARSKTFYLYRRQPGGEPLRVRLGEFPAMSVAQARLAAEKARGEHVAAPKPVRRTKTVDKPLTLAEAMTRYLAEREHHGKPLKPRTQADYLSMVSAAKPKQPGQRGRPGKPGILHPLAGKLLTRITADELRQVYADGKARGSRRAAMAMITLQAVLAHFGVKVVDNPLGKGAVRRIKLPSYEPEPHAIPKAFLGAWWRAACRAGTPEVGGSTLAGDYYRLRLLTGTRQVEILGDAHGNEPLKMKDINLKRGRLVLHDTKNRRDHTIYLSHQARDIVKKHYRADTPDAPLFEGLTNPRNTLYAINKAAGLDEKEIKSHDLRDTFISVALKLCNVYVVKKMVNHIIRKTDVTGAVYADVEEHDLVDAWQEVGDFLEEQAVILATEPA